MPERQCERRRLEHRTPRARARELPAERPRRASCDTDPIIISNPTVAKAKAAAEQYKLAEFSGDAMDVINHPDVEAVWICSPSQFHSDQIKACAAAGKHVFCEK